MSTGDVNPAPFASENVTPDCHSTSRPTVPMTAQSSRPSERRCGLLAPYISVQVGKRLISGPTSDQVRPPSRESIAAMNQSVIGSSPASVMSCLMRPSMSWMWSPSIWARPPIGTEFQPGEA